MVDENGQPVTHAVPDSEILAHLDRHSKAVMRPLLHTSEFCAACHKAAIPRALDDYKWLRAMTPYDEWQAASFTKQSPLPFYRKDVVSTCQTCHMLKEALPTTASDYGAKDGKLVSHRWPGGNTLIPQYYKFDEQAQKVADFLRNGVFNVDIFALEKGKCSSDGVRLGVDRATWPRQLLACRGRNPNRRCCDPEQRSSSLACARAARLLRILGGFHRKRRPARHSSKAASFSPMAISIHPPTPSPTASSTTRASSTIFTRSGIIGCWLTTTPSSRDAANWSAIASGYPKI
jgi:hypothetical protein